MDRIRRAAVAAALALFFASSSAFAHAFLASATPAPGNTVHTPPAKVEITFSSSVEPAFSTIIVQNASGSRVDKNDTHASAGNDKSLSVDVENLIPGAYTVIWHATATDTHKTQGSFTFTIER